MTNYRDTYRQIFQSVGVILGLLLLSWSSMAQDSLTLSKAIEIGLANNFDILLQKETQKIANNNNSLLAAGFFPTLIGGVNESDRYSSIDNTENPFTFFQGETKVRNFSASPFVQMNWTLFNGFRAYASRAKLALLEEQSKGQTTLIVENVLQAIVLSYYDLVLQKSRLEVFQTTLDLSRDRYAYFLLKKELGAVSTFDVLQVKGAYQADSVNYMNQEMMYRRSQRNIQLLLATEEDVFYIPTEEFATEYEAIGLSEFQENWEINNQTIQNQYINEQIRKQDVRLAQTGLYPTLSTNMGSGYDYSFTQIHGNPDKAISKTLNYYFNFSIQFTLFNGGNTMRAIENAKIQETISQLSTEQIKVQLSKDVINRYDQYQSLRNIYRVQQSALGDSELSLSIAADKFQSGVINSFDYRSVQLQYLTAYLTLLQTQYNLVEVQTDLLRLSGGILNVYEQ